ncbi:hypothetical protein [Streptomyces broussonetiae]|uniref:Uncharacterized protein n=1 Tax=Streptomyces broussonetiae TaxID=2686304 RepID=A0A6I6NMH4_9ACTN|nr:hypothetical protein [Streptomyces broussonetiae]QHA09117.1 hypothetical protein GQF42_43210 [Streptomyces broussonetiae]
MTTPDENDTPQVDDETRQRSAEQRNITAPTPRDVRAEADDEGESEPSAGETQAP